MCCTQPVFAESREFPKEEARSDETPNNPQNGKNGSRNGLKELEKKRDTDKNDGKGSKPSQGPFPGVSKPSVAIEDVEKHNSPEKGVWVALNGHVYDVTEFYQSHPGGARILLHYAGQNASTIFNKFHNKDTIPKFLHPNQYVGPLAAPMEAAEDITVPGDEDARQERVKNKPGLSHMFNVSDFEYVALKVLSPNAWAYYSSGADDEITLRENHSAFLRIFFRPRVLVDVSGVDISTEMLGVKTDAPFYCLATALAGLGHEDGELSIARGCGKANIMQMISTAASYTLKEIVDAALPGQKQWFQLYLTKNRDEAFDTIKYCEKRGLGAIFITVDTPQMGRREKDLRFRLFEGMDESDEGEQLVSPAEKDPAVYYKDASLSWADVDAYRKATKLPLVLKGVQRVEDVLMAIDHGLDAVVLLNHGGRQLDFARAPLEVLAEVMPILKEKNLEKRIEVYIDGGVRRGTDVLKALCLGAKGVGLGRPFVYANSSYGEKGVAYMSQLLKEEVRLGMQLLGANKISDLTPDLLDMSSFQARAPPPDNLYAKSYQALSPPKFKDE